MAPLCHAASHITRPAICDQPYATSHTRSAIRDQPYAFSHTRSAKRTIRQAPAPPASSPPRPHTHPRLHPACRCRHHGRHMHRTKRQKTRAHQHAEKRRKNHKIEHDRLPSHNALRVRSNTRSNLRPTPSHGKRFLRESLLFCRSRCRYGSRRRTAGSKELQSILNRVS